MIIENEKDFKIIDDRVNKFFFRDKELPDQVFKEQFGNFVCDGFDESEPPDFWDDVLQPLAKASGDNEVNVIILDTNIYEYFVTNYNLYCAYTLDVNDSGEEYYARLHTGPGVDPKIYPGDSGIYPYAPAIKIVWIPPSGKWSIYGDRSYEVIMLGFAEGFHFKIPKTNNANWISASEAIKGFLYFPWVERAPVEKFHEELLKNYSK